ncbi:hypothetical protein [Pleionea sp. CnH1-48]|uniref:hypothetical protein n=1 Tax=Pleionea sp. CnH1-48 TaxID=2954494 RepID=UPI002097EEE9|nr:hypothetical protein [Pleionea sp. CnH1-48]MCO7223677.1 hypothetical protein [Pleionea sp. CnH1-48]
MKNFVLLLSSLFISVASMAQTPTEEAREVMSNYDFMEGNWLAINRSLSPDFSIKEQPFFLKIRTNSSGLMQKNQWRSLKEGFEADPENLPKLRKLKKASQYFGTVFNTFDPASQAITTAFFAAESSSWDINSRQFTYSDGLIEASGESQDDFGPYQYYEKIEKLSEDKHQFVSQRLYETLGFWITVDSYVAYRVKRK